MLICQACQSPPDFAAVFEKLTNRAAQADVLIGRFHRSVGEEECHGQERPDDHRVLPADVGEISQVASNDRARDSGNVGQREVPPRLVRCLYAVRNPRCKVRAIMVSVSPPHTAEGPCPFLLTEEIRKIEDRRDR